MVSLLLVFAAEINGLVVAGLDLQDKSQFSIDVC